VESSRDRDTQIRERNAKSKTVRVREIAELLGVTHQRASKIVQERGFPEPVGVNGHSREWDRAKSGSLFQAPAAREALPVGLPDQQARINERGLPFYRSRPFSLVGVSGGE
jgi:hypothetical protein